MFDTNTLGTTTVTSQDNQILTFPSGYLKI